MRIKPWLVAGGIIVALAACGFGVYKIADSLARDSIESSASGALEQQIKDRLGSDAKVNVELGDGSVISGLGSGELKDVKATVTIGYDAIVRQLHNQGATMVETVTGSGDTLTLSGTSEVGGIPVPLQAMVRLVPDGAGLKAQLTGLKAAGAGIDASVLPQSLRSQLTEAPVPLPALPAGITITSVTGAPDGMTVGLHADSITMDSLRSGL